MKSRVKKARSSSGEKVSPKAETIAQKVYGTLNPKSPMKLPKAAKVIEQLHQQGYTFQTIRDCLLWAINQPGNGDFKGWAYYLKGAAPEYLTRKRRGKDQTPFESIYACWERDREGANPTDRKQPWNACTASDEERDKYRKIQEERAIHA